MTTRKLFAEACGLHEFEVPHNTRSVIKLLKSFCHKYDLEWNIGPGLQKDFSIWIVRETTGMFVEVEDNSLSSGIELAVTVAHLNLEKARDSKVVDLQTWKIRNRRQ